MVTQAEAHHRNLSSITVIILSKKAWTGMPDDQRNLVVQQYIPRTADIYIALASPQYPGEHMSINKPNPAVLNLYPYVANYPVNQVDLYGLFEKNPKDSYSKCYEKCLNSPEVKQTQELAQKFITFSVPIMGLLTGATEIYTKGAVPFVLLFGKKLKGVTIPLAQISMLKACGWIARYIKFLNKASLVATAGSLSFYSFTGDWSNIYCALICAGGGGYQGARKY